MSAQSGDSSTVENTNESRKFLECNEDLRKVSVMLSRDEAGYSLVVCLATTCGLDRHTWLSLGAEKLVSVGLKR